MQDGTDAATRDPGTCFIVGEASVTWPTSQVSISERFEELLNVNAARGYELRSWKMTALAFEFEGEQHMTETVVAVFERGVHEPPAVQS